MTRLDEMFTEALQRQATTPSDERLTAVAEVTVHRARRHRRARAAVEVVGTLVVVGVGLFVGSTLLGGNATPPAATTVPTPAPNPIVDARPTRACRRRRR